MKTQKVQIETIKLDPSNPRSITKEAFERLKQSITDFPEMQSVKPLVVADGYALAGNMRLLAYKDLGYRELHVLDVSEWSQAKRDEFMIKDNTHYGSWDYDALANEWDTLPLTEWGVAVWDTEVEDVKGLTDEDDVPEAPQEPITKLGDVWILGEHRVMCGDSTSKEAVEILMDGQKADMVFTDPPYGMFLEADYTSLSWGDRKGKKYDNVIGDHDDFTPDLINSIFENFGYCKEVFLWGADYYYKHIPEFDKGHYMVWDKTLESNGDAGSNSEFELLWTKTKHKRQVIHFNWFRFFGLSKQDIKTRMHPTQKPLQVCLPFIEPYTKEGGLIVDIYLGSGSTLIAAEKTNRKCYGMELDPKYCDVIVKRWEDFTGKKAHLEENEFEVITQAH